MNRFRCILADPPWPYRDRNARGAAARHYACALTLEDLLALPVGELAESDAHLWLWTPNAFLADGTAARVARAWGFAPKTVVTWCKTTHDGRARFGTGHYVRNASEHLLFCLRGHLPVLDRSVPSYFLAPAGRVHSRKPDASYAIIERLSPGPRLELFATRVMPGWEAEGFEIDGRDIRVALEARAAALKAEGGEIAIKTQSACSPRRASRPELG